MERRTGLRRDAAVGWLVFSAYLILGLCLNRFFPFQGMDAWFRLFLFGTLPRAGALGALLWSDLRRSGATRFGPSGVSPSSAALHAALMLGLWSLLMTQMRGEPWGWNARALAIPACLVVGLFEEYLFRGILLDDLAARFGPVPASFGSALLFTVFHTRPQAVAAWPHIFLTGMVFANLRLRSMSLIQLAAIHAAADSLFFFHGKESAAEYGSVYYVFLAGLFVYAACTAKPARRPAAPRFPR